ncbi:hypothetical protein FI667_g16155, partial [Globisporangium splendens]
MEITTSKPRASWLELRHHFTSSDCVRDGAGHSRIDEEPAARTESESAACHVPLIALSVNAPFFFTWLPSAGGASVSIRKASEVSLDGRFEEEPERSMTNEPTGSHDDVRRKIGGIAGGDGDMHATRDSEVVVQSNNDESDEISLAARMQDTYPFASPVDARTSHRIDVIMNDDATEDDNQFENRNDNNIITNSGGGELPGKSSIAFILGRSNMRDSEYENESHEDEEEEGNWSEVSSDTSSLGTGYKVTWLLHVSIVVNTHLACVNWNLPAPAELRATARDAAVAHVSGQRSAVPSSRSQIKKSRICKFENCTREESAVRCLGAPAARKTSVCAGNTVRNPELWLLPKRNHGYANSANCLFVLLIACAGGSTKCTIEGCDNRAKSRGVCWSHGGGKNCSELACTKTAVSNGLCWAHGGGSNGLTGYATCRQAMRGGRLQETGVRAQWEPLFTPSAAAERPGVLIVKGRTTSMTELIGVVTTSRAPPLHEELWAFVELVVQAPPTVASGGDGSGGDASSATQFLALVQSRARQLLRVRQQNDNQELQAGGTQEHGATAVAAVVEQNGGAMDASERIARQVLDGGLSKRDGESERGTIDDEEEDKSDTLSDCTTITETSSVYGIHNTWVDLATLYAMPFVMQQQTSDGSSSRRLQPVPPLNITHEQSHLHKIFSESQRSLHTMRAVATVDALRKVLDRGVTVLHFSGHGGQIAGAHHANNRNYLVFEDTQCTGLAHLVDADTLRNVLNGGGGALMPSEELQSHESALALALNGSHSADEDEPPRSGGSMLRSLSSSSRGFESSRGGPSGTLKLVFVSSCHSKAIGEVFIQAGVAHVVCVRCEDQILDESSSMFSHSFYHAALTGKTVHQAFEIARVRVRAEMRIPDSEGDKFVLLESSQLHATSCPLSSNGDDDVPQSIEVNSTSSAVCTCSASTSQFVFTDLATGKWVDVSPVNKFSKTLPPISESFVGREQELHQLAGLVHSQRFVTIRGPPGIGKSTLSIKLAHFVADRNVFPDGVAFVRLRGVQSLEGMESAIKSALCPDGSGGGQPSDKEMPLQHVLADLKVLLVLDNMEDPINANPSAVRDFLLQLLQTTPHLSFLMTARQAMGGGIAGFGEKVVSLNRLSHFHAADLFLKQSPRPLLISEILGAAAIEPTSSDGKSRAASVLDALTEHPLMAFLDGHPQAISLCAPLLQDRSLAELTRAVLSRGVSELQVVGLPAHDRSAVNTLVTSLGVSLEQVKMHHGQDALRFFSLLGLLPAGAMAADFKSLWGPNWEPLVETLLRFSLIQRNRIPGFTSLAKSSSNSRGLPKRSHVTGTTSSTRRSSRSNSRTSDGYDQTLLAALKSYGEYISGGGSSQAKADSAMDQDAVNLVGARSSGDNKHGAMLNTLTRSGRASRVAEHVAQLDSQAEIMSVCVSYSTFPFITSYARSLLGMYDGADGSSDSDNGNNNEEMPLAASVCSQDRDLFLYNCARHFWKVSYWVFQHICTLAARSSASYLILDMHESNLWMLLDLHLRMIDDWTRQDSNAAANAFDTSSELSNDNGGSLTVDCSTATQTNLTVLREKIGTYVVDVACFFAHALFLSGRHRGAWSAANKSLHIAKHHKDTRNEANTRKLMGILLTTETKFDEAKAQFGMALILYKAVGDKLGQAASLSAIGMIHTRKGNLRGAHNCFTKALTLYEWFKHALGQLNCHQRLANLEKKLRDGDGVTRKLHLQHGGVGSSSNAGYSHHYAATRRLQGDLNRKRNGEYIVRWVGHEMSLLLELPHNGTMTDKLHEAQSEPSCASSSSLSGVGIAVGFTSPPPRSLIKSGSTPGVSNSPKKCRLGLLIDQKEKERASATACAAAAGASILSSAAEAAQPGDKLKNSSFARRREYDAAIRKLGNAIGGGGAQSLDM